MSSRTSTEAGKLRARRNDEFPVHLSVDLGGPAGATKVGMIQDAVVGF